MHGNLEPEEHVLKDNNKVNKNEVPDIPKQDGYGCPYPRRKLRKQRPLDEG